MNKIKIEIPKGIRYLSDWIEFTLPTHPCIIDKKLTGCGFTEYVLRGKFNAIWISPRKALLENKSTQHNPYIINESGEKYEIPEQRYLYYARSGEPELGVDKDLESKIPKLEADEEGTEEEDYGIFKSNLLSAVDMFLLYGKPIKICVTYDSFRKVREILEERNIFDSFYCVVDEMQSIFSDGTFKPDTELEFINALQGISNLSYVSATPMIEEALDELDEFKDLPYYELDWETQDPSRIIHPRVVAKPCKNINKVIKKYITDHKEGKFDKRVATLSNGNSEIIESKELIFYVNSVKNICDAIRQNKLTPEEVNIICAKRRSNKRKIREAFYYVFRYLKRDTKEMPDLDHLISDVPTPDPITGEVKNKPITFCTKTVYLGADFYSKCARSIILSDATVNSLMVDITLDLPQILGRQRDDENPWKYEAEIWYREGCGAGDITMEEFNKILQKKIKKTENLLLSYDVSPNVAKHDLAEKYLKDTKVSNYKDDYVGVNKHAGNDLKPQLNKVVYVAEKRSFTIQNIDYQDRFTVFNKIKEVFGDEAVSETSIINEILSNLDQYTQFTDKMKRCCWYVNNGYNVELIPEPFKIYIKSLGTDFILSKSGRKSLLDAALNSRSTSRVYTAEDLDEVVIRYFEEQGTIRWSKADLKQVIGDIYKSLGISKTPKASDIQQWFEIKELRLTINGKRIPGFEIIRKK